MDAYPILITFITKKKFENIIFDDVTLTFKRSFSGFSPNTSAVYTQIYNDIVFKLNSRKLFEIINTIGISFT